MLGNIRNIKKGGDRCTVPVSHGLPYVVTW